MNEKLSNLLLGFYKRLPGVSNSFILEVQERLGFEFPSDYVDVMNEFDGGEGGIGIGTLILYSIDEMIEANNQYNYLMKHIPDFYLFGQDAADTGFAFHKRNKTAHSFGMLSDFDTDPIIFCGNNFTEFLEHLDNCLPT
jgi:hypothetical protein